MEHFSSSTINPGYIIPVLSTHPHIVLYFSAVPKYSVTILVSGFYSPLSLWFWCFPILFLALMLPLPSQLTWGLQFFFHSDFSFLSFPEVQSFDPLSKLAELSIGSFFTLRPSQNRSQIYGLFINCTCIYIPKKLYALDKGTCMYVRRCI